MRDYYFEAKHQLFANSLPSIYSLAVESLALLDALLFFIYLVVDVDSVETTDYINLIFLEIATSI